MDYLDNVGYDVFRGKEYCCETLRCLYSCRYDDCVDVKCGYLEGNLWHRISLSASRGVPRDS